MASYLDPKNDFIFYHIFGKHPHLAISYLNELMPFAVETAEFIPWTEVPHNPGRLDTNINFKCSNNLSNHQFFVDMQVQWVIPFRGRIVFINGNAYARKQYRKLAYQTNLSQPVYTLAILTEIFDHQSERFFHHYPTVYCEDNGEAIPGYEIIMIELPKFRPEKPENKSLWLRFLNETGNTQELPPEIMENEYTRRAAEICEESRFTEAQIDGYDNYWWGILEQMEIYSKLARLTQEQIKQLIHK